MLRQFSVCCALAIPVGAFAFDPPTGDFSRAASDEFRVLTYNVANQFPNIPALLDEHTRILQAVDPDIITLQEVTTSVTTAEIETALDTIFPSDSWTVVLGEFNAGGDRNALASRYALSLTGVDTSPESEIRGTTLALVDLPDGTFSSDVYMMTAHMKSGATATDDMRRQVHCDAVVAWMMDAQTVGGEIDLPSNTPILLAGDLNIGSGDSGPNAPYHPYSTLITGDIFDEGTFGLDGGPDWDGGSNGDSAPYDHSNGDVHTSSSSPEPVSRADRFIYTDSVMHATSRFILNTSTMDSGALTTAGLLASDTANASDHLPAVTDFTLGPDLTPPGILLVNEFAYDDPSGDDFSFLELINVGSSPINLQAPIDYHIKRAQASGMPTSDPGSEIETADWDLEGVIPPGGLFVLYNSVGDSASVAAVIEANLPGLQRQDLPGPFGAFNLTNGSNSGFAVVMTEATGPSDTSDTLVEAYLYEDTDSGVDHFFRTDSDDDGGNGLLIVLSGPQQTPSSLVSDTLSFSRDVFDVTPNSYVNWIFGDTMTPGLPNATTIPVELSVFASE